MSDIVNAETRSRFMAGIKSVNTKPEMQVRQLLHQAGFVIAFMSGAYPALLISGYHVGKR